MIVANAANETRAPLGVGFFVYPDDACSLSTRTLSPVSDSLHLIGLARQTRTRLKSRHSTASRPVRILASSTEGRDLLLPVFAVFSRCANTAALSATSVPAVEQNALCVFCGETFASHDILTANAVAVSRQDALPSSPVLCVGGGMSTLLSALSIYSSASRDVAKHISATVEGSPSRDVATYVTASVEGLLSRAVCLSEFSIPGKLSSWVSGANLSCCGEFSAVGWHFLPNSAAAITISAPWYRAYARKYTNLSYYASCRCGAGHSFTGACALPLNFRRALRL